VAEDSRTDSYVLDEEQMTAMAVAAHRRVPRKGKADIGGRMRVVQILKSAGVSTRAFPERIAGSTNEVWRAGDYIIRVGFVDGAERLRREARLAQYLPHQIGYPSVVASGIEPFGEWIVVRHRPGYMLSEAWAVLDGPTRQSAVREVAGAIKALHNTHLEPAVAEDLRFREGEGPLQLPHQLPAARVIELLEEARKLPYMDNGLIDAAVERATALEDVIWAHERNGLVHGDLHFENVVVNDGVVVALVDFEWSRIGPGEIDIDMLARFCANPQMHVGGSYYLHNDAFKDVMRWFAEEYPEIFEREFFLDRLMMCGLAFEVPWLLKFPPTGPASTLGDFHPVNQLKELLEKGTHAERLDWKPTYSPYL
jgi:aminoglycoside phosphotransferase (APT) family kinase protein